jgi:hypothetical protein
MTTQEKIQKAIDKKELYAVTEVTPVDWKQAFDTYKQLAKEGNAKAQFNLGYMFARGDIMERDFASAFEWYEKAAGQGDSRAHYNLSLMYERGEFVLPNNIKAKEHLARAIELGDERAQTITTLANAKEALKTGDREQARSLFNSIASQCKEAEMGIIACDVVFKSIYNIHIQYSYHSSGTKNNKKFWKLGDAVKTETDLTMTNSSAHSWQYMVKSLIRASDGFVNISTFGGVLKAGEVQSNVIDPHDYAQSNICGVAVYSDREGTVSKPVFSFNFPDISALPDDEATANLAERQRQANVEMELHNKTAKPGGCFVLTACYGYEDAPTVLIFRQFRDKQLSRYTWGRAFISWYYNYGPGWAGYIENKPRLKALLRFFFRQISKLMPR